jgi:glycosyltransferase involved in cell wall biosynthesis
MSANLRAAMQVIRSIPEGGVIYSTGETWGLPVALAGLLARRRYAHVIYAHRVYSPFWLKLIHSLRHVLRVDGWICVTNYQAGLLRRALGTAGAPVAAISQGVDTAFFDPAKANPPSRPPYILSVGTEMRNYPLLFEAVRDLPIEVAVKASSAWMSASRERFASIPPNVKLITERLSYTELRDLYAGAALVVVPLYDTPQAAGITTILEAMAMEKCVVATGSKGLPDSLVDNETGLIVDSVSVTLSETVAELFDNPKHLSTLAARGRRSAIREMSLDRHAVSIGSFISAVAYGLGGDS